VLVFCTLLNSDIVSTEIILQCVPLATEPGISLIIEQEYVRCVRNEKECVCSAPNCCNREQRSASNILISSKIIKVMPGSVASGTLCIREIIFYFPIKISVAVNKIQDKCCFVQHCFNFVKTSQLKHTCTKEHGSHTFGQKLIMLLWASLKLLSSQIRPMSSFLPNNINHIMLSVSVPVMKFLIHWTSTLSFLLFLEILCQPWNHFLVYVECSWVVSLSREATIHRKAMLHFSMSIQNLYHVTHLETSSALTNAWILWV